MSVITRTNSRRLERGNLSQRLLCLSFACAALSLAIGCGPDKQPAETAQLGEWKGSDRPMVISGSPQRDSAADKNSEDQLGEADWKLLNQLGPKPIWDRLAELKQLGKKKSPTQPSPKYLSSQ